MMVKVTIDFGDLNVAQALEWVYRAIDEIGSNESRAWHFYQMGEQTGQYYCNAPDGEAVGFGTDILNDVARALRDSLDEEEAHDPREV